MSTKEIGAVTASFGCLATSPTVKYIADPLCSHDLTLTLGDKSHIWIRDTLAGQSKIINEKIKMCVALEFNVNIYFIIIEILKKGIFGCPAAL